MAKNWRGSIRTDINGIQVSIGDIVHCYDGQEGEYSSSLRGVLNERDGAIFVSDNGLAISCAEHVEIINPIAIDSNIKGK